jgi:hypothetical protein
MAELVVSSGEHETDQARSAEGVADHTDAEERLKALIGTSGERISDELKELRKVYKKPPVYKQNDKTLSLLDWESMMVMFLTLCEYKPTEWVAIAYSFLDPFLQRTASTHMQNRGETTHMYSWAQFSTLLRTLTGALNTEKVARAEFRAFVWKGNAFATSENHLRFEDILRRCGSNRPDDTSISDKYEHALPEKWLSRVFPKAGGGDWILSELMTTVEHLARQLAERSSNTNQADTPSTNPAPKPAWQQVKDKKRARTNQNGPAKGAGPSSSQAANKPAFVKKTPDEFEFLMTEERCLKCGTKGHRKDACRLPNVKAAAMLADVLSHNVKGKPEN